MKNGKIELNDDELMEVSGGEDLGLTIYVMELVCYKCGTSIREEQFKELKKGMENQFCETCGRIKKCEWKLIRYEHMPILKSHIP